MKNEQGMSLVSVMIAAGMVGMIAVFVMKMQDNQMKTQNDVIVRSEINNFMQKLNFYFSNPGYCEKTFENITILPGGREDITKVIAPNDKVILEVGQKYGGGSFKLLSIKQDDFYFDNKESTSGLLTLNVSFEKIKKSFGTKILNKKIEVYLYSDIDGKVGGCGNNPITMNQNSGDAKDITAEQLKKYLEEKRQGGDEGNNHDISHLQPKTQEDLKKLIEGNPQLKLMQESIKNIQELNKKFDNDDSF